MKIPKRAALKKIIKIRQPANELRRIFILKKLKESRTTTTEPAKGTMQ